MNLTKEECIAICDFIEINIFDNIRRDDEIDNMNWLVMMMDIYKRAKEKANETN